MTPETVFERKKSLFLSSSSSWGSDGRFRMCGLGTLGRA